MNSGPFDDPDAGPTEAAFADPKPGDRFHEMFSFWMYVLAVEPEGRVAVMEANPPCTLPRDGKVTVYGSHDAYRQDWRDSVGFWVRLADRGNNIAGWFSGWPEPEPPDHHFVD